MKRWRRDLLKIRSKSAERRSKRKRKMMNELSLKQRRKEESRLRESDYFKKRKIEDRLKLLPKKLSLEKMSIKRHLEQQFSIDNMMNRSMNLNLKSNICRLSLLI